MDKWTRKYLKLAKTLAEDNNSCYSRQIGSVLVSKENLISGLGYNGAAIGVPHADSKEYLANLWNILEKDQLDTLSTEEIFDKAGFIKKYEGCKQCPRRILNIPSGERLDFCPCSHSERNALFSSAVLGVSTKDSTLFCYCQVPCHECSIAIIQCRVKKIVCCYFGYPLYNKSSVGLLNMAKIEINVVDPVTFKPIEPILWKNSY